MVPGDLPDATRWVRLPLDGRARLEAVGVLDRFDDPLAVVDALDPDLNPAHEFRFRLLGVRELLLRPAPTWRLEGLLTFDGLGCLYGPPGSGKSFAALSWALHIASNRPWLGRAVAWSPVIYVAGEGAFALGSRITAWLDANELTADDLDGHFHVVGETVPLLEPSAVGAFIADIKAAIPGNPALVIFDTLARAIPGGDENSARDVGLAIAAADRIRTATGAALLFVHHTQKTGELERGSSALRGAADTMILLRERNGGLVLENTKQRNAPPADPIPIRLHPYGPSAIVAAADGATLTTGTLSRVERQALESLAAVVQDDGASAKEWADSSQLPNGSFYRARRRLLDLSW